MENSRYREDRIKYVEATMQDIEDAVLEGNTEAFIEHVHEDTKNYHGAILDQGIITFEAETIKMFREIERMREEGVSVGCSIAGGPTPIILTTPDNRNFVLSNLDKALGELKKDVTYMECKVVG